MDVSRLSHASLRTLAMLIGRSRIGNRRLGNRTIEEVISTWSRRFVRSAISNPVRVDGHSISHTGQPSSLKIGSGLYELKTVRLVCSVLKPGMTFVDVGAHIGWYTMVAARAVGRMGHVYAFEPEPTNFELLQKNVVGNGYHGHVTLTPKAISDVPRRA